MKIIYFLLIVILNFSSNAFADNIKKTGDILQIALPIYALGSTIYNDDFIDGGKNFLMTFIATQASVEILKRTVREKRPDNSDKISFPSGHTAASFSSASFIHKRYGIKQAIVPYILASYVGYSRIKSKKHYTHDVVAGALLAGTFSYFLVDKKISISSVGDGAIISYTSNF